MKEEGVLKVSANPFHTLLTAESNKRQNKAYQRLNNDQEETWSVIQRARQSCINTNRSQI